MYVSAIHLNAKASTSQHSLSSAVAKSKKREPHGKRDKSHTDEQTVSCLLQDATPTLQNITNTATENTTINNALTNNNNNNNNNTCNSNIITDDVNESYTINQNKRTVMATYCTCCFREIPTNTLIVNSSQLETIAKDMSVSKLHEISENERHCSLPEAKLETFKEEREEKQQEEEELEYELFNVDELYNSNNKGAKNDQKKKKNKTNNNNNRNYNNNNNKKQSHDKQFNKLKKPSRSSKMKSDAAVALKERVYEHAMERRAEAIRCYNKSKEERMASIEIDKHQIEVLWKEFVSHNETEAMMFDNSNDNNNNDNKITTTTTKADVQNDELELHSWSNYYSLECKAAVVHLYKMLKERTRVTSELHHMTVAKDKQHQLGETEYNCMCKSNKSKVIELIGCPCCGIACFCSLRCWHRQCRRHMESGECALLRRIYFPLMEFYYTTPQSHTRLRHSYSHHRAETTESDLFQPLTSLSVTPIGLEPASWNTSINPERALEAQCILQVSQVLVQSALEGYRASWDNVYKKTHWKENRELNSHEELCKKREENDDDNDDDDDECGNADIDLMDAFAAKSIANSIKADISNNTITTIDENKMQGNRITVKVEECNNNKQVEVIRRVECIAPLSEHATLPLPENFATANSNNSSDHQSEHVKKEQREETKSTVNVAATHNKPYCKVEIPCYVDLACLVSNFDKMPKEHGRLFGRYYRTFYKHFQHIVLQVIDALMENNNNNNNNKEGAEKYIEENSNLLGEDESDLDNMNNTEVVSEEFFSRLGATAQCNSFGIYTSSGESIAFGFYPFASYFNHSCKPNLCRVMYEYGFQCASFYALQDINQGEPLTICYIDVEEENSAIRRQQLMASYRFHCMCDRCAGNASLASYSSSEPSFSTTTNDNNDDNSIQLCKHCHIHGYMRPLLLSLEHSQPSNSVVTIDNNSINNNNSDSKNDFSNIKKSEDTNNIEHKKDKLSVIIRECTICQRRVKQFITEEKKRK